MSTTLERPPRRSEAITLPDDGGLAASATITLAQLPPGARLVLRCRKDWRAASVSSIEEDCVLLNVASPSGHTYRLRRPHDSLLAFDGAIPVLGVAERATPVECERAAWRVSLARYDARW